MNDSLPLLHDPVELGPYGAGRARFAITTDGGQMAAELGAMMVDLAVDDDHDTPATTDVHEFVVTARGPAWLSHRWGVWRDGQPCETTVAENYIRSYVVWEITRLALEATSTLRPVHAAALSLHDQGIVLAGASGAGKSTTAGWLTHHGWSFLTDEIAFLELRPDKTWWIEPFPRPIGIRRPSPLDAVLGDDTHDPETPVAASRFGAIGGPAPLVAIIVIDRFREVEHPEPVAPATAVRLLAEQLPGLRALGRPVFRAIVELVEHVPVWRVGTADLQRADDELRQIVGSVSS